MYLSPSDPDIATLYRRIETGRLDLQPNFQRGEVWGRVKKQRLIDSILRDWHIPPIHIVKPSEGDVLEVLDGQQRLVAIRDFMNGVFSIDGYQMPEDPDIASLDGLFWPDLSSSQKAKIEDFTIRVITISNYGPGEPGELFYRLNQPTNLTSAEQRNAYFGPARKQVKSLSGFMTDIGFETQTLGFSNSRMAYDDVIAKCFVTIENSTLLKKVTANSVTARYRDAIQFDKKIESGIETSIRLLGDCICNGDDSIRVRLNKATLYSWLLFIYEAQASYNVDLSNLCLFIKVFEEIRNRDLLSPILRNQKLGVSSGFISDLMGIFTDRSSSRVADTSSVRLRNIIQWGVYSFLESESLSPDLQKLNSKFIHFSRNHEHVNDGMLLNFVNEVEWGSSI